MRTCICEGRYNYLLALWAVIAATSVRFHIGLVACGVNAFLGKTNHAFADLSVMTVSFDVFFACQSTVGRTYVFDLSMGRARFELEEDDVEDRHDVVVMGMV